jgi:hypothetical protein
MPRELTGWTYTDAVNQVECDRCRVPATEYCRSPMGRKVWPPHAIRVMAVEEMFPESFKVEAISGNQLVDLINAMQPRAQG